MIGVTPVHASRTWSALLGEGLTRCNGRMVTIVDEVLLAERGYYFDRDDDFDLAWLRLVENERSAAMSDALRVGADAR